MWRRLGVRLRALLRRGRVEAELDEELRYHLDRETERHVADGLGAEEARRAAERAFGNVAWLKDGMRDAWGLGWWEALRQDVRFSLRSFRRSPVFAVTVVATIALALGLNTAAFTLFDAYVLRPLRVRDPYSLYEFIRADRRGVYHRFSWQQYQEVRRLPASTESFAYRPFFARVEGRPSFGAAVSGDYFRVLGGTPALGRLLLPGDAERRGAAVMVLGYDAWRTRFGADSSLVGRRLLLRGVPITVVGVAAAGFDGLSAVTPDFWLPLSTAAVLDGGSSPHDVSAPGTALRIILRLPHGMEQGEAVGILSSWAAAESATEPDSARANRVQLMSAASRLPRTWSTIEAFLPLLISFALVLLIACANVANMMLARGLARQREIGIRLSLGAGRRRLIRQLLTEAAVLALPGAALGFWLSRRAVAAGVRALFATIPADVGPSFKVTALLPDARVFLFLLVVTVAATLLFGLVPALQTTRPAIVRATRGDFETPTRRGRLRGALVVAQITACALLLVCTGVLLRGAQWASRAKTGIRSGDVVQLELEDRARAAALERLRTEPGVRAMAAATSSPVDGIFPSVGAHAAGSAEIQQIAYAFVTGSYFPVLGIRLLGGRGFTEAEEGQDAPVAIVSEAAAARLWHGHDPVGRYIELAGDAAPGSPLARVHLTRVVGVARDAVSGWIGTGLERPVVYFPTPQGTPGAHVLVQVAGPADVARDRIDRDLAEGDPGAVDDIHTLDGFLGIQRYPFDVGSWISLAVGLIALVLTVTGIYGVISYLVTQRTKEIGIRVALGADRPAVVGLVLQDALVLGGIGTAGGLLLALGASALLSTAVEMIDPRDPLAYLGAAVVVLGASVCSAWAPSRRAARVDPMEALRAE